LLIGRQANRWLANPQGGRRGEPATPLAPAARLLVALLDRLEQVAGRGRLRLVEISACDNRV
jgi:hypothetical protein